MKLSPMITVDETFPILVGVGFISFLLFGLVLWFLIWLEDYIDKRLDEI